jgi:hypothetical protein
VGTNTAEQGLLGAPSPGSIESLQPNFATGGGTPTPGGATGKNMTECMQAWDSATHVAKTRWRQICARTLTEPHI